MTQRALMKRVSDRVPEIKDLPSHQLRLVRRAIKETARLIRESEAETLNPSETMAFMKSLVKDAGSPAHRLRAYRMRMDVTQTELAKKSGITQAHLSEMENGRRVIGVNSAKKLAAVLGCDYRSLV